MKNKKGFTLIELLAIIVILAIIAVITVPIILNIIENSKKGAIVDSAYGYKDAVQLFYLSNSFDDSSVDLPTGVYSIFDLADEFSVDGEAPIDGWIELKSGRVIDFSLKFGEYVASYDETNNTVVVVKNGELKYNSNLVDVSEIIESLNGVVKADGAKYLTTVQEVYYNPVSGKKCNSSDSVSTTGTVTGCMHWYLYSVKDDYANMLLDHNITAAGSNDGVWALEADYIAGLTAIMDGENVVGYQVTEGVGSKAVSAGITYPSSITSFPKYGSSNGQSLNSRGPVTALNTLKSLTSGWTGTQIPKVPNISNIDEHIIPKEKNDNRYQINYSGYKARLITKEEAEYLGCTINSRPDWMVKGTYGENTSTYANIYGYWTSSPNVMDSYDVWNVYYLYLSYNDFANITYRGVRPVITVKITDVL